MRDSNKVCKYHFFARNVEAIQWTGRNMDELFNFIDGSSPDDSQYWKRLKEELLHDEDCVADATLNFGDMVIREFDWVIKDGFGGIHVISSGETFNWLLHDSSDNEFIGYEFTQDDIDIIRAKILERDFYENG